MSLINFIEHDSSNYKDRTIENIKKTDLTFIFATNFSSSGTLLTIKECKIRKKPVILIDLNQKLITPIRIEKAITKLNNAISMDYSINRKELHDIDVFNNSIGTKGNFLSNFYQLSNPIIDKNQFQYWNSEGYYMSLRTKELHEKQEIANLSKLGGKYSKKASKMFILDMDENSRVRYMFETINKKFKANPDLLKLLLETTVPIIEKNNWNDTLFGVCENTMMGANFLGKCLMHYRELSRGINVNIAGNGLGTISNFNQKDLDDYIYNFLFIIFKDDRLITKINHIYSGGQTGVDESGIKASQLLKIPSTIIAPKGWRFRPLKGKDVYNEQQFKQRFIL